MQPKQSLLLTGACLSRRAVPWGWHGVAAGPKCLHQGGGVRMVDAASVRDMLPWKALVASLRSGFAEGATKSPLRQKHKLDERADSNTPTLLLMPAWSDAYIGVKIISVFPTNRHRSDGIPTINGNYMLMSGTDGRPLALLDGGELTARRTAAASVLAATWLARPDASKLLVVGSGRLAGNLARAYSSLFPISQVAVWNHRAGGAEALAFELRSEGIPATAETNIESTCRSSDIITCATLSPDPVIKGEWLGPGSHLDLVGGFTPLMREADDEAIRKSSVYVDTFAGALSEAGDIVQPLESGVLLREEISGDLFKLSRGEARGRACGDEITMFKSVGHAIEDLVAAAAVYEGLLRERASERV